MGPIELFVIADVFTAEAWDLYRRTWDIVKNLDVYSVPGFKKGHDDEDKMVCFGFKPFRIKFGGEGEYMRIKKSIFASDIDNVVLASEFDPEKFIKDYVKHELEIIKASRKDILMITIPTFGRPTMDGIRELGYELVNMGVKYELELRKHVNILRVGDYVSVSTVWGADNIKSLLRTNYRGEIITMVRFAYDLSNIASRIHALYKKYNLLDE